VIENIASATQIVDARLEHLRVGVDPRPESVLRRVLRRIGSPESEDGEAVAEELGPE
jgi:hypothetical protein